MTYRMKMLEAHRGHLRTLLADMTREHACFLICTVAQGRDEVLLLVKEVLPIADADLLVHKPDQLSVAPDAMLRAARRAQALDAAVCMVHTHPMSEGEVAFSRADDYGNESTFRFFSRLLPNRPNSCLVFDRNLECVAGRVYLSATDWVSIRCVDVVSGSNWLRLQAKRSLTKEIEEMYARHAQLLGPAGQAKVAELHIGFVGCGGLGSVEVQVWCHSGLKRFSLIEFDHLEKSNMPRVVGCTPEDAKNKERKVEIAARYIRSYDPSADIQVHEAPIEDPGLLKDLISLDAIICGTDDTTSRAFLNQFCQQYYMPVLDMGVEFAADERTGRLVKEVGRVNLMLPGTVCLACAGQIDPKRLADEALTEEQKQSRAGYISGLDVKQPAMMMFNMQVAARGAQHLISWFTGLASLESDCYDRFRFLGLCAEAGIKPVRKRSVNGCLFCGEEASLQGVGDAAEMLVQPRPR